MNESIARMSMIREYLVGFLLLAVIGVGLWAFHSRHAAIQGSAEEAAKNSSSELIGKRPAQLATGPLTTARPGRQKGHSPEPHSADSIGSQSGQIRFVNGLQARVDLALAGDPIVGCEFLRDYEVCRNVVSARHEPDGIGILGAARDEADLDRLEHMVFGGPFEQAVEYCDGFGSDSLDRFVYQNILIRSAQSSVFSSRLKSAISVGESAIGAEIRGKILLDGLARGRLAAANAMVRGQFQPEHLKDKFAYGDANVLLAVMLLRRHLVDLRDDKSLELIETTLEKTMSKRQVHDVQQKAEVIASLPEFLAQGSTSSEIGPTGPEFYECAAEVLPD